MLKVPGIVLLSWSLLIANYCWGQSVKQAYWEGKIYIKVKPEYNIKLPEFNQVSNTQAVDTELTGLMNELEAVNAVAMKCLAPNGETLGANIYEVEYQADHKTEELIERLGHLPYVAYAERIPIYRLTEFTPDDYNVFNDLYHLDLINAELAWDISQGNEEVVIAIVDDAVMVDHEDLQNNIWINPGEIPGNGIDDDRNGYVDDVNGYDVATGTPNPGSLASLLTHGTRVAGCAAASTNNGRGIASIGFNCKIMGVKSTSNPSSADSRIVTNPFEGVQYAIDAGADVVNMSFGGFGRSQAFQELIDEGNRQGIVFVAAAGNEGEDVEQFPASYNHVISVAATDANDRKADFSNYHSTVDISAPGVNIRTTFANVDRNAYTRTNGTSFASPIVAGVVGLMRSVNPCATPEEIEAILESTADNIDGLNPSLVGKLGGGRVNAAQALAAVSAPNQPEAGFVVDNSSECSNFITFTVVQEGEEDCAAANRFNWQITGADGFAISTREATPRVEFPRSGNYEVTLTVANSAGSDEVTQMVEIEINPNAFINAGSDTVVCLGEEITLKGSTSASPVSVSWSPPLGLNDTATLTPTFSATRGGGTYYLNVLGEDGCELTDSIQLDVFRPPFITVSPADTMIMAGDTILLQANGAIYYEWEPAFSLNSDTLSTPLAFPTETTTYTIRGEGPGRCEGETIYTIQVNPETSNRPLVFDQGTIDPLYPNPARESVNLSGYFDQPIALKVICRDVQGRELAVITDLAKVSGAFQYEWRLPSELTAGWYWITWEVGDRQKAQSLQLR